MAEYIERAAAERILYDGCHTTDGREVLDDVVELWHMIQNLPSADVAPVRRGRWIKDGEDGPVYCSECGEEHEWGDYRATYCDTCGAKMDRGQEE